MQTQGSSSGTSPAYFQSKKVWIIGESASLIAALFAMVGAHALLQRTGRSLACKIALEAGAVVAILAAGTGGTWYVAKRTKEVPAPSEQNTPRPEPVPLGPTPEPPAKTNSSSERPVHTDSPSTKSPEIPLPYPRFYDQATSQYRSGGSESACTMLAVYAASRLIHNVDALNPQEFSWITEGIEEGKQRSIDTATHAIVGDLVAEHFGNELEAEEDFNSLFSVDPTLNQEVDECRKQWQADTTSEAARLKLAKKMKQKNEQILRAAFNAPPVVATLTASMETLLIVRKSDGHAVVIDSHTGTPYAPAGQVQGGYVVEFESVEKLIQWILDKRFPLLGDDMDPSLGEQMSQPTIFKIRAKT